MNFKKIILRSTIWLFTLLFVLAGSIFLYFADVNRVRTIIENDFKKQSNCSIILGNMQWDLDGFRIGVSTTNFSLYDKDGNLILQAGPTRIVWRLRSIIQGNYSHFKKIESSNLYLNLVRKENGNLNIIEVFPKGEKGPPPKIDDLDIKNSIIHFVDQFNNKNKSVLYLDLNIDWNKKPITHIRNVNLTTRVGSLTSPSFLRLKGYYTERKKFNWDKDQINLYLLAKEIKFSDWESFLSGVPEIKGLNGDFNGFIHLQKDKNKNSISVRSKSRTRNLNILYKTKTQEENINIPDTKYSLLANVEKNKITIKNLNSNINELSYVLKGSLYNWSKSLPEIDLDFSTNRFNFKSVKKYLPLVLLPPDTRARIEPVNDDGFLKINVKLKGPYIKPKYFGSIELSDFNLTPESGFLEFIHGLNGYLTLNEDIVNVERLEIPIGKKNLLIKGIVDNKKLKTTVNLKGNGLDIKTLQGIVSNIDANASAFLSRVDNYGELDLDLNVSSEANKAPKFVGMIIFHDAGSSLLIEEPIDIKNLYGEFSLDGAKLNFDKISGLLNNEPFSVDGNLSLAEDEKINLNLKSAHLKILSSLLNLFSKNSSLLINKDSIKGELSNLDLLIQGEISKPILNGMLFINNIGFEIPELPEKFSNISGDLLFNGNQLELKNLMGLFDQTNFRATGFIDNLLTNPSPRFELIAENFDIKNLWIYLKKQLQNTPLAAQINDILELTGIASLDLFLESNLVTGNILHKNTHLKYKYSPFDLNDLEGKITIGKNDLMIYDLMGRIGDKNEFSTNLTVYNHNNPDFYVEGGGNVNLDLPYSSTVLNPKQPNLFMADNVIPTTVDYTFTYPVAHVIFNSMLDEMLMLDIDPFESGMALITKPENLNYIASGELDLDTEKMNIYLQRFNIKSKELSITTRGSIKKIDSADPELMLVYETDEPTKTYMIIKPIVPIKNNLRIFGDIQLSGSVNGTSLKPIFASNASLSDIMIQPVFDPDKRVNIKDGVVNLYFDGQSGNFQSMFNNIEYFSFFAMALSVSALYENPVIYLNEFSLDVDPGNIYAVGSYDPTDGKVSIGSQARDLELSKLSEFILLDPKKLKGNTNFSLMVDTKGKTQKEIIANTNGTFTFLVKDGQIGEIALLHKGLQVASILKQGIFGFNIKNIFSLFLSFKNGEFKKVDGELNIKNGILHEKYFHYRADNLLLNSFGTADLNNFLANISVYGYIPNISKDAFKVEGMKDAILLVPNILDKGLGIVNKFLNYIPLISTEPPKYFKFIIEGDLKDQKKMVRKTAGSFKWLKGRRLKKEWKFVPKPEEEANNKVKI